MQAHRSVTILSTDTFHVTLTGRDNYYRDGIATAIGPAIAEVVVSQAVRADGVLCFPTYSVRVNGQHRYGGVASHLNGDLAHAVRQSCSFANVERTFA